MNGPPKKRRLAALHSLGSWQHKKALRAHDAALAAATGQPAHRFAGKHDRAGLARLRRDWPGDQLLPTFSDSCGRPRSLAIALRTVFFCWSSMVAEKVRSGVAMAS